MAKKQLTAEEKLQAALVPVEEQPYKVPDNWHWVRLGCVSSLYRGVSYKKDDVHLIKQKNDCLIMRGGNIGEGYIDVEADNVYVSSELVKEEQFVKADDIIIVASTGSNKVIGRAGISFINYSDVAFGAFLMLVRPNERTNTRFIDYYFQSEIYRNRIRDLATGVNINNIRANYITGLPLPFPTVAEQQRIVTCIESLFAKLDEAKEKIQEVLDGADLRRAAILHQAVTGKLTEQWRKENNISEDTWEKKKLGEIGVMERGRSKHRPRNDPKLFGGSYPFIQTGDVAAAGMFITTHKQTLSEIGFKQSRLFPAGTLCITIAANIGDVAILSYDCCFPDSVVGFTPHKDQVTSEYVYYLMSVIQQELKASAPATAQKNINLKVLNEVVITVPTVDEQKEIVRLLDNLLTREQSTVTACEEALATIDTLKKSILARAFRGQMGTNDPAEPSAKELLQEILEA